MGTDQPEALKCAVCGEPVAFAMSAECNWCDRRYHLNQRNDIEAVGLGSFEKSARADIGSAKSLGDLFPPVQAEASFERAKGGGRFGKGAGFVQNAADGDAHGWYSLMSRWLGFQVSRETLAIPNANRAALSAAACCRPFGASGIFGDPSLRADARSYVLSPLRG